MNGEHLYTVFLVLVVVWSVRFLVRFQVAEWRNRSAAPSSSSEPRRP